MSITIGLFIGIFMVLSGVIEILIRLITQNTEGFWRAAFDDVGEFVICILLVGMMSAVITMGLLKDHKMGVGLFKERKENVVEYKTIVIQSDKIIYVEK